MSLPDPSHDQTVSKSFANHHGNEIIDYCCGVTVIQHPLQWELQKTTLAHAKMSIMLGAPEVLTIGSHFIKLIGAKKVLDIGTFTGASALAWSLALPADGKVVTMDVDLENFKTFGLPVLEKAAELKAKVEAVEGPALKHLNKLIADGKAGTFDFAFIDADSQNKSDYYNRCVDLLRSGGVIICDNALQSGHVVNYDHSKVSPAQLTDEANKQIFLDDRTNSFLINCADGLHIAFKK